MKLGLISNEKENDIDFSKVLDSLIPKSRKNEHKKIVLIPKDPLINQRFKQIPIKSKLISQGPKFNLIFFIISLMIFKYDNPRMKPIILAKAGLPNNAIGNIEIIE